MFEALAIKLMPVAIGAMITLALYLIVCFIILIMAPPPKQRRKQ